MEGKENKHQFSSTGPLDFGHSIHACPVRLSLRLQDMKRPCR
jgi:hypothetical protein